MRKICGYFVKKTNFFSPDAPFRGLFSVFAAAGLRRRASRTHSSEPAISSLNLVKFIN